MTLTASEADRADIMISVWSAEKPFGNPTDMENYRTGSYKLRWLKTEG